MTIWVFYGLHGMARDEFADPAAALAHFIDLETRGAKYVYAEEDTGQQYDRQTLANLANVTLTSGSEGPTA